jgi:hypothetical protein
MSTEHLRSNPMPNTVYYFTAVHRAKLDGRGPSTFSIGALLTGVGREVAAVLRGITWQPTGRRGLNIRLSPLSSTWLRGHEGNYGKHWTEL